MSFYFVLSLFPFLLVIAAVVGWIPSTTLLKNVVQWISDYLPPGSRSLVFDTIIGLTHNYSSYLSFGLFATIWTASSGFVSLMESLSVVYGVKETRGFWAKRFLAICATIIAAFFLIASFGILTFGHRVAGSIALHVRFLLSYRAPWDLLRWTVSFLLILFALDLVHYYLPNGKRPWRWISPGNLTVAVSLMLATLGFDLYLKYFDNYPRVYGALAVFIILLTWIYVASVILLVAAEVDTVIGELKTAEAAS